MRRRIHRRAPGAVALLVGMATASAGRSEPTLTLGAAVDSAWAHHPTIAAATAEQDAAGAAVGEAKAARWPSVRLEGSATQYQENMLVTPIHGFRPDVLPPFDTTLFQGTLGARWLLLDAGGRGARIETARQHSAGATAALAATEQELLTAVVDAYLLVLTEKQILNAQDARMQALDAEAARAHQMLRAGRAPQVEVLRAEAARASAEAERIRLVATLDVAERDLARVAGLPPEATRVSQLVPLVAADTTLPDRDAILAAALQRSPVLEQARAASRAATAETRLARSTRWPQLEAVGNYVGWADDEGDDALEWNAGLKIAMPLFTGGAISKGIERADAAARGGASQLETVQLQLQSEVDRAVARVTGARARTVSLTTAVERYAEVARIEALSLGAGSGTQTDYLKSEADLLQARAGLAEARFSEAGARVDLARVSGSLDRAWIARTLEGRP